MNGKRGSILLLGRSRDQRGLTLVELLVGMIVMGILSTMLLLTWFSLNDSYSYSVKSYEARDNARVAVSRLQREIRDAQSTADDTPALTHAQPGWIAFNTTFNEVDNQNPRTVPHLVAYRLYADGTLWRFENETGALYPTSGDANAAGATLILKNMVNADVQMFEYSSVNEGGSIGFVWSVPSEIDLGTILGVRIHLLVDLNPGKSPVYVDFTTLAQLRNQRSY